MGQQITSKVYKRRNYFIDKQFQSKFILKFCLLVAFGSLLTMGILYFLSSHSTTVSFVKARVVTMTTADFLLPLLLQTVIVVTLVVSLGAVMVTLFVSHKIAGPLFRFKQTLQEMVAGNFSTQVRLRKDDQLHELATEFNQMITSVRNQVRIAEAAAQAVRNEAEVIGEYNIEDSKRRHFLELKQKLHELEKALHFFRV